MNTIALPSDGVNQEATLPTEKKTKNKKKVVLPRPQKMEDAQMYYLRATQFIKDNPIRYAKKRQINEKAKAASNLWRQAMKNVGVRGIPRKETNEYDKVKAEYEKLKNKQ